ncbi:lipid A-modifier LpxR family protein [Henriciella sp.]|uniref:lipid A-modifier LpxR family protein n=1 Tax=Henriciella sp. TaxID=1968823 RepID=UPI002632BB33|nr:lipid A-modifier LpxR family protein [Henriciella sp.]
MILSVSTLAVIACQGCQAGPQGYVSAPVQRYETPRQTVSGDSPNPEARLPEATLAQLDNGPLLQSDASFSLTRSQTQSAPSISITPVLDKGGLNADLNFGDGFSAVRMSNARAVVDFEGARKSANLITPSRPVKEFDASLSLSAANAQTGLGFDVGVVPRFSLRQDGRFETRRVGGEVRIGQNFDQRGEAVDAKSWYLFAGADGEALVYEPYGERNFTSKMALRDQVTVGDMQAGVSFTQGGGQVSLSYIRREVSYNERGMRGQEETEDFAGVSFTLRK